MSHRFLFPLSLLATLAVAPLSAQEAEKIAFKVVAKKGDAAAFVVKTRQEQAFDMGGQQMEAGHEMTKDVVVKVIEAGADGLTVEVNIKRLRGTYNVPMMDPLEFDTAPPADGKKEKEEEGEDEGAFGKPSSGMLKKVLGEIAGKTFTAKVAANGKATELAGLKELLDAARTKAGPMGTQLLASMISDSTCRQLVSAMFGPLPKEPVAVGGTWEGSNDENPASNLPTDRKSTLTLAKTDADTVEITVAGTIKTKAKASEGAEGDADGRHMMADAKIENGKVEGRMVVSRKDGFVVHAESKESMNITAPGPMGGEMQIGIKTTTTMERAKPEAAPASGDKK